MDKGMFTEKIYVARSEGGGNEEGKEREREASFHDNNGTEKEGRGGRGGGQGRKEMKK